MTHCRARLLSGSVIFGLGDTLSGLVILGLGDSFSGSVILGLGDSFSALSGSIIPYMSKFKVEFNYSTIASTIQLFNYSTSTFQLFNYSPIQLFNYSPIQLFNYSTIQLFNYSTIQLTYGAKVLVQNTCSFFSNSETTSENQKQLVRLRIFRSFRIWVQKFCVSFC